MGHRFNSSTGYWEAYYSKRHPITRQSVGYRRTRLKSRNEAIRTEKLLVIKVEDKIKETIMPRWEHLIDQYLIHCNVTGLTKKSIYNAEKNLKAATLPVWGGRFIDSITPAEIRTLINVIYADKSESHRKAILKFIRLAFNLAVDKGFVPRNPSPTISFKVGRKLKTVLTHTQANQLLNKAKDFDWEWYPHVAFALYTGMRSGELFALRWDRVNLEDRLIRVDSSWNNKDGFKSTKTGDERNVEIAPNLTIVIKELHLLTGSGEFVLPRISRWAKGEQARELRLFLTSIGLPEIRFHDLRATWCTLLLSKGIEPIKVMKMGGWRTLETMMRYVREAGVDIRGTTDNFHLHDPHYRCADVTQITPK